ncbi:MAG: tRNA (N6-threonylcarbamoyladenosine(37)-N6)-methyltransferase TrmO [Dehalococcoidia bacterium]|jgi:tRNA-Thr(GGU) m(6)t(6)A37 methyltransferase TsaA
MAEIKLNPIGIVHNEIKQTGFHDHQNIVSEIEIDAKWAELLDGIDEFSHIIVLFWMHKVPSDAEPPVKVHPRGRVDLPLVGTFATRSPHRPNSIGLTIVKLLERRGNVLRVQGLDAIDGTPVIDIKSYMIPKIARNEIRMPEWVAKLRQPPKP